MQDSEPVSPPGDVPLGELVKLPSAPTSKAEPSPTTRPRERASENQIIDKAREKLVKTQLNLANRKTAVEIEDHKGRIEREREDHRLLWKFRKYFGIAGLGIVVFWQIAVLAIVCYQGREVFKLPQSVAIALITTTTANVIGLLVIVMKFIFAPIATATAHRQKDFKKSKSSNRH